MEPPAQFRRLLLHHRKTPQLKDETQMMDESIANAMLCRVSRLVSQRMRIYNDGMLGAGR